MFDPYTNSDAKVMLAKELRRIMKAIYKMSGVQVSD
jgi:hypothetical protein